MPATGTPVSLAQAVSSQGVALQSAQTGNVAGNLVPMDGYRTVYLEVVEANTGTATLTVSGSRDGTNLFALWAAPTAANGRTYAATFSITQNTRTWLILEDVAPYIQAATSSNSGKVTVTAYALP